MIKRTVPLVCVVGVFSVTLGITGVGLSTASATPQSVSASHSASKNNSPHIKLDAGKKSLSQSPATVAGKVGKTTVNVLEQSQDGNLHLHQVKTKTRSGTLNAIAGAQQESNTLAVSVDHPMKELDSVPPRAVRPATVDPKISSQWAYSRLNFPSLWNTTTGAGTRVAIVDSGINASHEDLVGRVGAGADFRGKAGVPSDTNDGDGHGTHVAGIIAADRNNGVGGVGIAPSTTVLPVRVLDSNGEGTSSGVTNGVIWSANQNVDVINMSLGGTYDDPVLHTAIQYAVNRGVTVVAAAGNEGSDGDQDSYPGSYPEVISVAASDSWDYVAYFSNYGSYVDVTAPGVDILSTWPQNRYEYLDGTSMATPFVAGLVADLKSVKPDATVAQVRGAIESTATDIDDPGRDDYSGNGLINPSGAAAAISGVTTSPHSPPAPSPMIKTQTTISVPTLHHVGDFVTATARVRNTSTGAGVGGAKVTMYAYSGGNTAPNLVLTTNSKGYASWRFRVYKDTSMFVETPASIGHYYGSEDMNGLPIRFVPIVKARSKHHRLVLSVSPNLKQRVTIQAKFSAGKHKKRAWHSIGYKSISRANHMRLYRGYPYRVYVSKGRSGSAHFVGVLSRAFRG